MLTPSGRRIPLNVLSNKIPKCVFSQLFLKFWIFDHFLVLAVPPLIAVEPRPNQCTGLQISIPVLYRQIIQAITRHVNQLENTQQHVCMYVGMYTHVCMYVCMYV